MAKGKASFLVYCDLIEKVDHLTHEELGRLFWHMLEYVNDKDPVMEDRVLLSAWKHIEVQMKKDLQKYRDRCKKNSENAKKRWNKNDATASDRMRTSAKHADIDKDIDKDIDTSTNVDDMHPTLSDVMEKVLDLYGEDVVHSMSEFFRTSAKAFFYHYDSQGWVKGNGLPLTNWETKLKEWVEKDRREQRPRPELPKVNPAAEKAEYFKNAPIMGTKKKK